MKSKSVSGLH